MPFIAQSVIPDYFKCALCVLKREIWKSKIEYREGKWLEFEIKLEKELKREKCLKWNSFRSYGNELSDFSI